jgi:multicomponent Na+:H+ antiporter subunit C
MTMWVLLVAFLAVGFYGLLAKRNVIKKILGLTILDHAVNLLLIMIGYREGGCAPIRLPGEEHAAFVARSVDPVPQALVLTSIVIGLGITMLMVALALRIRQCYRTLDGTEINRLRG